MNEHITELNPGNLQRIKIEKIMCDLYNDFFQNTWIIYLIGIVIIIVGFFLIRKLVMLLLQYIYREKWHLNKLESEDPYERYFAIRALRKYGTQRALPKLIEALKHDDDQDICEEAFISIDMIIERLSNRDEQTYKNLLLDVVMNHWNSDYSRVKAIYLLGKYKIMEGEEILISMLKTEKQLLIFKEIIITLGKLQSKKATEELISLLQGKKKQDLYREICTFLRLINAKEYVVEIENLIKDEYIRSKKYSSEGEYTFCVELAKTLISIGKGYEGIELLKKRLDFLNKWKIPYKEETKNEDIENINKEYFLREYEIQLIKEIIKEESDYINL
jgi:HEAT repeat protein